MSRETTTKPKKRVFQVIFGALFAGLIIFLLIIDSRIPKLAWREKQDAIHENSASITDSHKDKSSDTDLIKGLLRENLSDREFDFSIVVSEVSGKKILPGKPRESWIRVTTAISAVMDSLLEEMNAANSPIRGLRRINEGSRFFEDGLLLGLEKTEGITCAIPPTREGLVQRSGYPDLRIADEATGDVYYLDPKLMERGSENSSLRTFYFEPKGNTLKITEDATHLLLGIEHDGKDGDWEFLGYQLVDLSGLKVRLKAEFQASNREIYQESSVLENCIPKGEDGGG